MRITVGGCRDFNDYDLFSKCLNEYIKKLESSEEIVFLSGHCSGTDLMAEKFAQENGYKMEVYPAEWKRYGRGAGPKRNRLMVENCDSVIAFWDGKSKGTGNLIETAEKLLRQIEIEYI